MEKTLWCCIGTNFSKGKYYDYSTLSERKSDSIKMFIGNSFRDWRWFKSKGWSCEKVQVTIKPLS